MAVRRVVAEKYHWHDLDDTMVLLESAVAGVYKAAAGNPDDPSLAAAARGLYAILLAVRDREVIGRRRRTDFQKRVADFEQKVFADLLPLESTHWPAQQLAPRGHRGRKFLVGELVVVAERCVDALNGDPRLTDLGEVQIKRIDNDPELARSIANSMLEAVAHFMPGLVDDAPYDKTGPEAAVALARELLVVSMDRLSDEDRGLRRLCAKEIVRKTLAFVGVPASTVKDWLKEFPNSRGRGKSVGISRPRRSTGEGTTKIPR